MCNQTFVAKSTTGTPQKFCSKQCSKRSQKEKKKRPRDGSSDLSKPVEPVRTSLESTTKQQRRASLLVAGAHIPATFTGSFLGKSTATNSAANSAAEFGDNRSTPWNLFGPERRMPSVSRVPSRSMQDMLQELEEEQQRKRDWEQDWESRWEKEKEKHLQEDEEDKWQGELLQPVPSLFKPAELKRKSRSKDQVRINKEKMHDVAIRRKNKGSNRFSKTASFADLAIADGSPKPTINDSIRDVTARSFTTSFLSMVEDARLEGADLWTKNEANLIKVFSPDAVAKRKSTEPPTFMWLPNEILQLMLRFALHEQWLALKDKTVANYVKYWCALLRSDYNVESSASNAASLCKATTREMKAQGEISAGQLRDGDGKAPIMPFDLRAVAPLIPPGWTQKLAWFAYSSIGIATGMRTVSLGAIVWGDIVASFKDVPEELQEEQYGDAFVSVIITSTETKGGTRDLQLRLEGFLDHDDACNSIYYLNQLALHHGIENGLRDLTKACYKCKKLSREKLQSRLFTGDIPGLFHAVCEVRQSFGGGGTGSWSFSAENGRRWPPSWPPSWPPWTWRNV